MKLLCDELEEVYARVCENAVRIQATDAFVRDLIRQGYDLSGYSECPEHGEEFRRLWDRADRLQTEVDRHEQARLAYVGAFHHLEFLTKGQVRQITPAHFLPWARKVQDEAARRLRGLPDLEPVSLRKPDWKVQGRIMLGSPGSTPPDRDPLTLLRWTDLAGRVEYWRRIEARQLESIAEYPEVIAKYTGERDRVLAIRADCSRHGDELAWLAEGVDRAAATAQRTGKSREIYRTTLGELIAYAESDGFDPVELVARAVRASERAYRVWNPPTKKER